MSDASVSPVLSHESGAIFSDDELYRYRLWRTWDDRPPMTFVMLNPSTADAESDDPTIRRCMGFARREGCGGIVVVNLFGLRVTRPVHLFDGSITEFANGPENRRQVAIAYDDAAIAGSPFVTAWGALKKPWRSTAHSWLWNRRDTEGRMLCLGRTADGSPRHPLYLRRDAPLTVWP